MYMSDEKNLTVFVDNIGRTLVGEETSSDKSTLTVKNPAILHVQPNQQTGQISVQLIPYFFKEFQKGGGDSTWVFNKANLTLADDMAMDDRLLSQYNNMFSPLEIPNQPELVGAGDAPVVKLFDD
jgi:hypothetical protein